MSQTLSITAPQRPASPLSGALAITSRVLRKFVRTPQLIVISTVQGAMFLLIFRYVFGGAISTGGAASYVSFLVPGYVVTGMLFSSIMAAVGMAEDLEGGFADRLRSLPVSRTSLIAGRALADTAVTVWGVLITWAMGFAVGFRTGSTVTTADLLAAVAISCVFALAFSWLFLTIGLMAKTAQAANGFSMIVFPFTFVSSAYVPVGSMPGWMQAFARNQPVTAMANAVRSLTIDLPGGVDTHAIVVALLWSAAIVAVMAPIATWRFARG